MSVQNDIIYRAYDRENDYLKQRQLFVLSFPEALGTPVITDEHYGWKFSRFPHPVSSYEYVADEPNSQEKELVGYYAAIPFAYKMASGKNVVCGMVCDVMTHPERRGKGIFTKIGRYATDDMKEKGLSFVTGYPIRPEVIPGHLKVGWKVVQKMPMYLRPLGVCSFLPRPLKFFSHILNPILRGAQLWSHFFMGSYQAEVMSTKEFLSLSEYPGFLRQWLSEQKNALIKSKEFLEWRTGAPEAQYLFVTLRHKGVLVGFSLVRPTTLKGIESLAVLDISILKEHFSGSRKLHSSLAKLAISLKKDVVVSIASRQWMRKYRFLSSFYVWTPSIFALIVKKLDVSLKDEELYESDPWHLFWIDSDDL